MSTTDLPSLRERDELMEHPSWVHHVADAATGKLVTTRLTHPVTPLSRAERLSQLLGTQFDRSIFGPPSYRLTVQKPYQASPLGWLRFQWALEVHGLGQGALHEEEGYAFWRIPKQGENVGIMEGVVLEPPQGLCLLTLDVATNNEPGLIGTIPIEVRKGDNVIASFKLTLPAGKEWVFHTFDLAFFPAPGQNWIRMLLQRGSGVEMVYFYNMTLAGSHFIPRGGL